MFYTKTVTTMKNDAENQEKIDEESIDNMLWDNLLNKILDNYIDFDYEIYIENFNIYEVINFEYNNKIYSVLYDIHSPFHKKSQNYFLRHIKCDDSITLVYPENRLPVREETKLKFEKIVRSKLEKLKKEKELMEIREENLKIYS